MQEPKESKDADIKKQLNEMIKTPPSPAPQNEEDELAQAIAMSLEATGGPSGSSGAAVCKTDVQYMKNKSKNLICIILYI